MPYAGVLSTGFQWSTQEIVSSFNVLFGTPQWAPDLAVFSIVQEKGFRSPMVTDVMAE